MNEFIVHTTAEVSEDANDALGRHLTVGKRSCAHSSFPHSGGKARLVGAFSLLVEMFHYHLSSTPMDAYSSPRRRGNPQGAVKSRQPDGDTKELSGSASKSPRDTRRRKGPLRLRASPRVRGRIQCILIGVCLFFTAHFIWTIGAIFSLLNSGEKTEIPKHFSSGGRIIYDYVSKEDTTRTLRGSASGEPVFAYIESEGHVSRHVPVVGPLHHFDPLKIDLKSQRRDHGGLKIELPLPPGTPRLIREYYYEPNIGPDEGADDDDADDDYVDGYYAFDDDILRGTDGVASNSGMDDRCRRIQEHRYMFPNCNEFHQMDRTNAENNFRYINHGAYREVFSLQTPSDLFAVKEILYESIGSSTDDELLEYVRMDAIVAERLTASPRIYDIYGHCSLSIASEYFYHGDIEDLSVGEVGYTATPDEKDNDDELRSRNGFTPEQKLVLGLEMAEALADLHGYVGGLIIHDDVQLAQFLFNKDKSRLKLNDFNRAEFPLWNGEGYCRYQNGKGGGKLFGEIPGYRPWNRRWFELIHFVLMRVCRYLEIARRIQGSAVGRGNRCLVTRQQPLHDPDGDISLRR